MHFGSLWIWWREKEEECVLTANRNGNVKTKYQPVYHEARHDNPGGYHAYSKFSKTLL